jgi:ABC-type Fe3+-hydroxamate transport system substrate-binding protein
MKHRVRSLAALMQVGAVSLAAQDADYPRTIIDGAGRELTFTQRPERIVVQGTAPFRSTVEGPETTEWRMR